MTTRARNTADIVEDAVATYATQSALTSGLGSKLDASEYVNWTSFTPTLTGGTWAAGNGTWSVKYARIGKVVFYKGSFTMGSTSVASASVAAVISLPITGAAAPPGDQTIQMFYRRTGSGNFLGFASVGTTVMIPQLVGVSGTRVTVPIGLTSNDPFAWDTGASMSWNGFYEAA